MMLHTEPHPLAGRTVTIKDGVTDKVQSAVVPGAQFRIEDWWDRVSSSSWDEAIGNPAAIHYTIRLIANQLPSDDEVVYGKIDHLGHIVHVSEFEAS